MMGEAFLGADLQNANCNLASHRLPHRRGDIGATGPRA